MDHRPESLSFFTGVKPGVVEDPFLRGIQGFRANTYSNTASVNGSYPLFRDLALDGGYSFSIRKTGSILAATSTGATFFNTNSQNWSVGPRYILTREDSLAFSYEQTLLTQTASTAGGQTIDTNLQSLSAIYARVMPGWSFRVAGGATLVEPASLAYPTAKIRISTDPERVTHVQLELSRQAAPSYYITAGALISNVGQVSIVHELSRRLSLQGNLSYAFNETVPSKTAKFTSFAAGVGLNYKLTKTMALDFSYNYYDFRTETAGLNYEILRNVVGFSLSAQWN